MATLLTLNNTKIKKGDKLHDDWKTAIMHLHPNSTKICPYQDIAKCKTACLNTAGRGGILKKVRLQMLFKKLVSVGLNYS